MLRRSRGNILAIIFAVIFILLTVVSALHHQQVTARRKVVRASANLQFAQGRRFAVAQELGRTTATVPSWTKVTGKVDELHQGIPETLIGGKLYSGLPDLVGDDPNTEPPAFHDHYSITPSTLDGALKVFGRRHYEVAVRQNQSYALYAPQGQIHVGGLYGWGNPTFKDDRESADAFSGVPALARARDAVKVKETGYGFVSSENGPITLGDKLGIGFLRPPPLRDYDQQLKSRLDTAYSSMEGSALSGNKTRSILGTTFDRVGEVFNLFLGRSDLSSTFTPSLEQAMAFRMPIIPAFSPTVPGLFFEFWFHVPFVSDGASIKASASVADGKGDAEEILSLKEDVDAKRKEVERVEGRLAGETDPATRDRLQQELDSARTALRRAESRLGEAAEDLQSNAENNNNQIQSQIPSQPKDPPTTRQQDIDTPIPPHGTPGWNYSGLFGNMLSLLTSVISGDASAILDRLAPPVRLIHFGGKDNNADTSFGFDGTTFQSEATWTVPRGRSFAFTGDMEIIGDLWVQKGGLFQVTGDLTLKKPSGGGSNPFAPAGRIVLEEGATLLVTGDLQAKGNSFTGTVIVGSLPGEVHPITSSILCGGSVQLPHGTFGGANLADLCRWVGAETESSNLVAAADILDEAFGQVAPNLAKIAGPFHFRRPYFAQYASTFQLTIVPTPLGPVPVPTPIPLPRSNALIPVFKGLTYLYSSSLNFSLGENLYTQADWWFFGQGAVPVIPKIDPTRAATGLAGMSLSASIEVDWEAEASALARDVISTGVVYVFTTTIRQVAVKVVTSAFPGAGLIIDALVTEIFNALDVKERTLRGLIDDLITRAMQPFQTAIEDVAKQLRSQVNDAVASSYLRELPGVLIYADTIQVGNTPLSEGTVSSSPASTAQLVSGMLVAKDTLNLNCNYAVGTFVSFQNNILAHRVYYVPYFGSASLYLPKSVAGADIVQQGVEVNYGREFDSGLAVDVGSGITSVVFEGWKK